MSVQGYLILLAHLFYADDPLMLVPLPIWQTEDSPVLYSIKNIHFEFLFFNRYLDRLDSTQLLSF